MNIVVKIWLLVFSYLTGIHSPLQKPSTDHPWRYVTTIHCGPGTLSPVYQGDRGLLKRRRNLTWWQRCSIWVIAVTTYCSKCASWWWGQAVLRISHHFPSGNPNQSQSWELRQWGQRLWEGDKQACGSLDHTESMITSLYIFYVSGCLLFCNYITKVVGKRNLLNFLSWFYWNNSDLNFTHTLH